MEQQGLKLHNLAPVAGARHKKKIVGRGTGSGHGKTATRGHKGQTASSGGGVRHGYEGGQTPLFKRLPKRGFTNVNRKEYAVVNLDDLNSACFAEGTKVTVELFVKEGFISKKYNLVKVLVNGKLEKKLVVCANKFSKSAEKGITEAGGSIEVI